MFIDDCVITNLARESRKVGTRTYLDKQYYLQASGDDKEAENADKWHNLQNQQLFTFKQSIIDYLHED